MRPPALIVALCYLCGLLLGRYISVPLQALGIGVMICLTPLVLRRTPNRLRGVCACLGLVAVGALWYTLRTDVLPASHISRFCDRADPLTITGTIAKDPDMREHYTLVTLDVRHIMVEADTMRTSGRILARLEPDIGAGAYGDTVRVSGHLRSPSPPRNPGGFDAWSYYTQRGIYGLTSVRASEDYTVTGLYTGRSFHTTVIRPLRHAAERAIDATLRGASGALVKGILLGQRAQVPEDILTTFSDIGLTHILAVSGLHVGLITLIVMTLFSLIRLPRLYMTLATLLVLILYAFITNLTPSVVRATIMAGLFLIGTLLDRQTNPVNILSVAALAILLVWPQAVFDLSFRLSFIATLSILLGYARFKALLPASLRRSTAWWKIWLVDGFGVSLAAQIGTLPVIAVTFFKVSLISPIANLFIGPLVFVSTTLGVATAVTGAISLDLARLFSAANWGALQGMIRISSLFALFPYASMDVPMPSLALMLAYYAVFLLFLKPPRRLTIRRSAIAAFAGAVGAGAYLWLKPDAFVITVIDVGQGDAVFVECPNGYTLLMDGGNRTPTFDTGERVVLPFLRAKGVRRIDTMVVSHPHLDHYGGLPAILSAIPVNEVIGSGLTPPSSAHRRWRETVASEQVPYRSATAGDSLRGAGRVRGVVLHPTPAFTGAPSGDINNASVVLHLAYGDFSILLTGDIEAEAEQNLVERGAARRSAVIKAPHHGSITSSSRALLEAVQPQAVVISVGAWNRFRHPSPQVLDRYRRMGAAVYRTDINGGVVIRSDGRSFHVEPTIKSAPVNRAITPSQALTRICLTGFWGGSIFR